MIDIYTKKTDSKDWILQNDLYFNLNTGNEEMSQKEIDLIRQIDEAKLTPDKHIETKYGLGFINFYPDCIIELDVENKMTKEKVFFIHFQMNNFHHALGLLYDMRLCLQTLTTTKKTRVLLSCTSGFTTGFFAEKLNEGVQLLNKDFEFNAVSYGNLYDMAKDYDVILLAPQVSFRLSEVGGVLKNKRVYA